MRIDFGQFFHGCRNKFINITNKSNESSNFTFSPYICSSLNPFNCKRNRKTNTVEEKRRNRDGGFDVMVERKAWRIVLDSDFIQFAYIAHRSHRVAPVFIHFHSQLQIGMCITPLCFVRASDGIFVKEKLLQQPSARSFPLRRRLFVVLSLCARSLIFFWHECWNTFDWISLFGRDPFVPLLLTGMMEKQCVQHEIECFFFHSSLSRRVCVYVSSSSCFWFVLIWTGRHAFGVH